MKNIQKLINVQGCQQEIENGCSKVKENWPEAGLIEYKDASVRVNIKPKSSSKKCWVLRNYCYFGTKHLQVNFAYIYTVNQDLPLLNFNKPQKSERKS